MNCIPASRYIWFGFQRFGPVFLIDKAEGVHGFPHVSDESGISHCLRSQFVHQGVTLRRGKASEIFRQGSRIRDMFLIGIRR